MILLLGITCGKTHSLELDWWGPCDLNSATSLVKSKFCSFQYFQSLLRVNNSDVLRVPNLALRWSMLQHLYMRAGRFGVRF